MTRQRERERALGVIASLLAMPLAAVVGMAMIAREGGVVTAQPGATITPTLTITSTATLAPVATDTPAPTLTPRYAYVHLDIVDARIEVCDELAPGGGGTVPPPLTGCVDVRPRSDVTPGAMGGEQYLLWASDAVRYRVYRTSPGWCEPLVVTATPEPSATATATITPDVIGTAVAGTLTALAPTATGTPRATDTRVPTPLPEATPTPAVWRLTLFPLFRGRGR